MYFDRVLGIQLNFCVLCCKIIKCLNNLKLKVNG